MLPTIIPFFHLFNNNNWLLKDQGPPLMIRSISNSDWNLNWQRFGPTFEIYNDSFNPHARRIVFFATILLKGLQVRNFPIKLKLQLSMASNLPSSEIGIISSSSIINFIFSNLSATSLSIMSHKKERITLRMLPRERELTHSRERELH